MRFQQLNRDPNNVLRKKLVKSKKDWIVVSSLALAGGLFFIGSSTIVKADTVNNTDVVETVSQNDATDTSTDTPTNNGDTNDNSDFEIPSTGVLYSNTGASDDKEELNIGIKWYITTEGVLHLGPGTLSSDNNEYFGQYDKYKNDYSNNNFGIKRISIDGHIDVPSTSRNFFRSLDLLTTIDNMQNFDVSNVTDFSSMFFDDPKLESLDLSSWKTSNATDMRSMFAGDTSLTKLDLSNFDTSKVTNLNNMFDGDVNLKELNLSNLDTSSATDMGFMFRGNTSLEDLIIPNDLDASSVFNMASMFDMRPELADEGTDYGSLTSLDLSNWNIPSLMDMSFMFANNSKLTSLKLPADVSSVYDYNSVFLNDKSLVGLDLSTWKMNESPNTGITEYNTGMFDGTNLSYIILGPDNVFQNINLPSEKSDTWYNTNPDADIVSFATDPVDESICKYYNGTKNPTETYTFVPNLNVTADVTIPSNLDDQIVKDVSGKIGDTVEVTVPEISGYTADKRTVTANVNLDGTITIDEAVTYTKDSAGSGGSGSSNNHHNNNNNNENNNNQNNTTVEHHNQTVATFNTKDNVPLYERNSDDTMSRVGNRALSSNSTWFSNSKLTIDGKSYYQVATNEYVKADQVYPYNAVKLGIRTNADSNKILFNAHGDKVTNRGLAANINWFTDRVIELNGTKYYRVATDEFVNANDVFVYKTLD